MKNIVTRRTRGNSTLDVFLTDHPNYFKAEVFVPVVNTDHCGVFVRPTKLIAAERFIGQFRDTRQQHKETLHQCFTEDETFRPVYGCTDANAAARLLVNCITKAVDKCIPLRKVKMSTKDPYFVTPLVKFLLRKRNKASKVSNHSDVMRLNVQIRHLIKLNKIRLLDTSRIMQKVGGRQLTKCVERI